MVKIPDRLYWLDRHSVVSTLVLALTLATTSAWGQYFQFSQYNFTPQRINPASVAASSDAQVALIYRNQSTAAGFRLNSSSLNAMYPFHTPQGKRWSGVGLSLLDDRSGQAGIFVTREAGLSYAVNLNVAAEQSISLGAKMLYQGRRLDIAGLYTAAQYIPDRGFDTSLSSGENLGDLKTDYFTFSMGMHWQKQKQGEPVVAYLDLSFFDLNRPDEQFITPSELNPTLVAGGGLRVYQGEHVGVFPQVLYTRSAANNVVNAGAIFRYTLYPQRPQESPFVNLITSYVFGRSAILGLQYNSKNLGIGVSYDFPFFDHNIANTGAIEVGLILRKDVSPKVKVRSAKETGKGKVAEQKPRKLGASVGVKKPAPPPVSRDTAKAKKPATQSAPTLSERLRYKQDSIAAQGVAGVIQHDPLVLEKATLRFIFEFNSSRPGADAREYLDELAKALKDNPELRLKLVGHTDNVGSDKFNMKLSLERAQAFKSYLSERGVDASRVTVEGKGMREPLNGNATPDEQALNRRVEMTILYEKKN